MSLIYDALRRAESERSPKDDSTSASAAELLRRAEKQARSQRATETSVADSEQSEPFSHERRSSAQDLLDVEDSSQDIASETSAPGPAALSDFETLHLPLPLDQHLAVLANNESPATEAFRLLSVRLRHMRRERPIQKLLICSTASQEGKSMIAANLACTIASSARQSVLLIEGDIRRPSLAEMFRVGPRPGLCEYLRRERPLAESIYRLEEAGLWFMPAGNSTKNFVELTQSSLLPGMIRQLDNFFPWIIIDSAPILPLADTSVWARLADSILMVARNSTTERRKLARGIEALDEDKLIGAIINSATTSTDDDYYYYRGDSNSSSTMADA